MTENKGVRLPVAPPTKPDSGQQDRSRVLPVAPPLPVQDQVVTSVPVSTVVDEPDVLDLGDVYVPAEVPDVRSGIVKLDRSTISGADGGIELDELLLTLLERGGSDLHLTTGSPPMIRVHGDVEPIEGFGPLTATQVREAVYTMLTERQKQRFEETHELDLAYSLPGAARFRVNVMMQRGAPAAVLRAIPWEIKALEALGMPEVVGGLADLPRGLVLVTGPTGSGKSTTLAAIIDRANRTRKGHIVTIEDPIEFVHPHRSCIVNQREVGEDTESFQAALRHALRQDPDILLVGEMRDLETIQIALTAAETGHLVFGTLHTSSAGSTIDRVIDVFPPQQQAQIRAQLAGSLQAVVCQTLCRTTDGKGRVAATEILMATPAVRNLIREGKLQSIPSALQTGSKFGMHTLNQDLASLVQAKSISYETAREKCSDVSELNQLLGLAPDGSE